MTEWYEEDGRIQTSLKLVLNEPKEGWTDRHIRTPNHMNEVDVIFADGTQGTSHIWCMNPWYADGGKFAGSAEHGSVEYWREKA